ncbi:hypothetical protein PHA51_01045 [Rodentibacter pneumotropicus]|uniref:MuF-C-terminal domain-containing protein n=1 Tax=Rodentibacter pneumotropicus TaxID=758 RepID=UPI00232F7B00|nr:hypothetical protein [Rodentibacter pneumotropicus]MDC2824626.1 hypothetical protein [Rodentibacter pneumotropicus]
MPKFDTQLQKQLQEYFAPLSSGFSNMLSPKEVAELQKAYGFEQPKPHQLSERDRAARLEAFNTNLATESAEMGKAFINNTANLPAEERYRAWEQAQEALKRQYAHLTEEQQQTALSAFNEHADVFRLADEEAGFFSRTGDFLSYIPTTFTKLGEQVTGLVAPESDARKWFKEATDEVESWRSDEAKMRALHIADATAKAKANGELGFTQFFANAVENPLETFGQFTESALPTVAAAAAGVAAAPVTGGASLALPAIVGGVQGAGETRNEIYDHIMAMPQAQLSQSPEYQALLAKGLSSEQARQALASSITEHGGEVLATGLSSAALSQLGGLARIGQVGKGALGSTAGKFASELITEPTDEIFQQFMGNKAINDIDPTHSLTDGLGEAAAGGLLFGAAGGAIAAADNAYRKPSEEQIQANSDQAVDDITNNTQSEPQPTQPKSPVNGSVLEKILADHQLDQARRDELYRELKSDIEDGRLQQRLNESDREYADLARAYLEQTGQMPEEVTQEKPFIDGKVYVKEFQRQRGLAENANLDNDSLAQKVFQEMLATPKNVEESAVNNSQNSVDDTRYSLNESADSDFARAVDIVAKGDNVSGYVNMGTTPNVLKSLGLPDTKIEIHPAVLHKVMRGKHNVTADTLKQLPQQINDPVAVMRSAPNSSNPNGYVVLTELFERENEKDKPIIAALHLKQGENGLELINIASVYGRSNTQIQRGLENDLIYWNKTKGLQLLNRLGLQLSPGLDSVTNLSARNIKTNDDIRQDVNIGGNAFELKPTGEQVGSNDPSLPTQALPTRQRQGMGAVGTDNVQQSTQQRNDQIQQDQQALSRLLGEETASHIQVVDRNTEIPSGKDVKKLVAKGVEGWFEISTKKLYLISDNITADETFSRDERLAWVAWHELAHAGVRVKYGDVLTRILAGASENIVVKVIARKIQQDRGDISYPVAVEEALVEIYAAYETGNWAALENRYKTKIHESYKQGKNSVADHLTQIANYIRKLMNLIFRNPKFTEKMTTEDVFNTLSGIKEGINTIVSSQQEQVMQDDVRYSLNENADSDFAKAVDEVVNGNVMRGYINMGTTPDVLKMLGLPDVKIRIQGKTIQKVMGEYLGIEQGNHSHIHNLTPEILKLLPKQINDPVAVFKSSTTDNGYVVLTELSETDSKTGREKPVIAALHLKSGKNGVEIIDVASAYGRSNNQIQTAFENDTLYLNKEKAQNLNTERLQLPWDFTSDNELFANNIKTETDLSQYQSEQLDDDVRYSVKQSVDNLAKTGKAEREAKQLSKLRTFNGFKSLVKEAGGWLDERIADGLRPVNDWIDTFKESGIAEHEAERLKDDMYRAKGVRDALNTEIEQEYLNPIIKKVAEIAKAHKLDELSAKRLAGYWISGRYAIEKNNSLLKQEHQAMLDAKKALNEANENGSAEEIALANHEYRKAERQYRYRKHDVELALDSNEDFKVGTAGGWSNAEAANFMQNIEKHIPRKDLEALAELVYDLNQKRLDIDHQAGRYTEEQYNEFKANRHYVPLTGDPNADENFDSISGAGSNALNVSKDRSLKGRKLSEAEDGIDASW